MLELNYLSSISFNRKDGHFYYNPRITLDELINTSDNILVSTACVGGILCKGTKDAQEKFLKFIIENKHRCWLEIQPHNFDLQIRYNQYLYKIANEYGLKLIATNDVHALNQDYADGRAIMQQSKKVIFMMRINVILIGKMEMNGRSIQKTMLITRFCIYGCDPRDSRFCRSDRII